MFGYLRQQFGVSNGAWLPIVHKAPKGPSRIALSLDDGPSPRTTIKVLELLKTYDARATFFLSGERAERYPELVQAIVDSGNTIYAHGYSHVRLDRLAPEAALDELQRTEALLAKARPTPQDYIVRLPYGSGHRSPDMHRLLKTWHPGCQIGHWRYDFKDFALADGCESVADVTRNCEAAVMAAFAYPNFLGSTILMHEDPIGVPTPYVGEVASILLEQILLTAQARGVAVTEMLPVRQKLVSRYVRTVYME
ncbi:polysaccharide deacetylase family protein [Asticcacaulis machinosus]|uniref:Chitooligosaccharide deacetylase n=1 Tax=Asticcacaulis machinosus TaxID=2984211 RepID=A0ABT5HFU3_9CAUL|nr:polysaccharide deacetylase family protein [Asticcacaulis machinosus]MDC7675097.1 polysaccharide deacetylase family protein [Asticcacaulis machinosus]